MSNLNVAIRRVEALEKKKAEEGVLKGALMNVAECLVYFKDYTEYDKQKALKKLERHGVKVELTHEGLEREFANLRKSGTFSELCLKCGRKLENPLSKEMGMGPICRKKKTTARVTSLI